MENGVHLLKNCRIRFSIIAVIMLTSFIISASPAQAFNLTSCSVISTSGIYNMTQSISGSNGSCIEIKARDVVIDCQGNSIRGTDALDSVGIYSSNDNLIIRNCTILDWYIGVREEGSNSGQVQYSNIISCAKGITLTSSESNKIFNTQISQNSVGITISFSENNVFYNNLINNTNNVQFVGSNRNYWNITQQNGLRIYTKGPYYGGNYWSTASSSYSDSCTDSNNDGFCDESFVLDSQNVDFLALSSKYVHDASIPYINIDSPRSGEILNNTNITLTLTANDPVYSFANITVFQGNQTIKSINSTQSGTFNLSLKVPRGGYYNITAIAYDLENNSNSSSIFNILTPMEVTSCGTDLDVTGENYILQNDISYSGGSNCLSIMADNIALDCRGRYITGREAPYKIYGININGRKNITISNCTLSRWSYGLFIQSSSGISIKDSYIHDNNFTGIYLYSSNSNEISGNVIGSNNLAGLNIESSSDNRIYNNLFSNNINVLFSGQKYENAWNTNKKEGKRVSSAGRFIGGNFWAGTDDYSKSCSDLDNNGFCDDYYDVQYATESPATGSFIQKILTGLFLGINGNFFASKSSNVDNLPLSDNFAADTIPPITNATLLLPNRTIISPNDWIRDNYVNITLNCSDGYGSGCNNTYYCATTSVNCTPSQKYKGIITINFNKNSTEVYYLRFFSNDKEDNNETIQNITIRSLSQNQKAVILSPKNMSYISSGNVSVLVSILRPNEENYILISIYNSSDELALPGINSTNNDTILKQVSLPEGSYRMEVMFYSSYGFNTREDVANFFVDTTPPEITSFLLNPAEKVFVGDKITSECLALDNFKGTFRGVVSGINTASAGEFTAYCNATDNAGNSAINGTDYTVMEHICNDGGRRCNGNDLEVCTDNAWNTNNCENGCLAQTASSEAKCSTKPISGKNLSTTNGTKLSNKTENGDGNLMSNPTLVAAGALLLLIVIGVMVFVYKKIFEKPKTNFSQKLAVLDAKIREAENKGKDTSSVRGEFALAEQDVSMGLFEMASPRFNQIEKELKKLK